MDRGRASRQTASKSRQKAARKTRTKATITQFTKRKIYDIATKAADARAETKYFATEEDKKYPPIVPNGTATKKCSVLAFSTTNEYLDDLATKVTYGGHDVKPMHMLRPFKDSNASGYLAQQAINGNYVLPWKPQLQFVIERNSVDISGGSSFDGNSPYTGSVNSQTYRLLPIRCRIIRATPKMHMGTTTKLEPEKDLFLNQYGEKQGVGQQSGDLLSRIDLEYAAINTRKWTVLNDTKFTLKSPPVVSKYTLATPNTGGGMNLMDMPTASDAEACKYLLYDVQLAQKKNGPVYFEDPNNATGVEATNAQAMQRREYVFMHFWFSSSDHLDHVDAQPDDLDMNIRARAVSMFKDS